MTTLPHLTRPYQKKTASSLKKSASGARSTKATTGGRSSKPASGEYPTLVPPRTTHYPSSSPPTVLAMSPGRVLLGPSTPSTICPNSRLATRLRSSGTSESTSMKSTNRKPAPPSPTTPPISFSIRASCGIVQREFLNTQKELFNPQPFPRQPFRLCLKKLFHFFPIHILNHFRFPIIIVRVVKISHAFNDV